MFNDKTVYITGGTGSWGKSLTKYLLLENVKEIRILSRNEANQVQMQREFKDNRIKYIIGDVRNLDRLTDTMKDTDYVFHLAALKHVPICEEHPTEAILTNITGTINVIEASLKNNVEKVIAVSSDKAVSPYNLYGMTKAVEEKLMIVANKKNDKTKFVCIRAGNVMGSNGSVIPLFINQLKNNKTLSITDARMTRFFITQDEAIKLLIKASTISHGGEILVMKMPSLKILDLANILGEYYCDTDYKIEYTHIRPGEKIHEELISPVEINQTYKLDDNYYLIVSSLLEEELKEVYHNFDDYDKVDFSSYTSGDILLDHDGILKRLQEGKFI